METEPGVKLDPHLNITSDIPGISGNLLANSVRGNDSVHLAGIHPVIGQ
jgi:hypothetical protein